jgi:hypothetical protein
LRDLGLALNAGGTNFETLQPKMQQAQPKKQQQHQPRREENSSAIFDARTIDAFKPKIIRAIAFLFIGLTTLGSAFGLGGYQEGQYTNILEEMVGQLTLKGVLLGVLLQAFTFVIQFVWARDKLSGWWLGATALSQYASISGFWFIGLKLAADLGFAGAAQQVVGFALVAAVTLTADIWPETKLVRS